MRGFDAGADDYLVKPFHYPELVARVAAVLRRRARRARQGPIRVGELVVDPVTRQGHGSASARSSWPTRSSRCCGRSPPSRGGCSPRRSCCATSGASGPMGRTRTLDSHASRLRRKLDPEGVALRLQLLGRRLPADRGMISPAHRRSAEPRAARAAPAAAGAGAAGGAAGSRRRRRRAPPARPARAGRARARASSTAPSTASAPSARRRRSPAASWCSPRSSAGARPRRGAGGDPRLLGRGAGAGRGRPGRGWRRRSTT